jgi:hypothetical protein
VLQYFLRNRDNLRGSLASAVNDFRKTFAQRPVGIDLRESQVGHRRRLECGQRVRQADLAVAKLFQQLDGTDSRHNARENTPSILVGQENVGSLFWKAEPLLISNRNLNFFRVRYGTTQKSVNRLADKLPQILLSFLPQ